MGERQGHEEQGGGEGGKPRSPGTCMSGDVAETLKELRATVQHRFLFQKTPPCSWREVGEWMGALTGVGRGGF